MKESMYPNAGVYTIDGKEFGFSYKTTLTASQKASFVGNVVSVVVGDNYYDFLMEIMFDYELVRKFTDIDLSEIQQSDNQIDQIELFFENTDVVSVIKESIESGLYEELRASVEKAIEYKTGIHENKIESSIAKIIGTLDNAIKNINVDELIGFTKIVEDMKNDITPDKILDAYSKSDIYKNRTKEIVAERNQAKKKFNKNSLKVVDENVTSPILSPEYEV